MDWPTRARAAIDGVDDWVGWVQSRWDESPGTAWTNQELLGHLCAWSDFLLDQVEALVGDRAEAIPRIDVDAWNAEQIDARRGWSPEQSVAEWRRTARRAADLGTRVPALVDGRQWRVAWSPSPVSVADLLDLWLAHFGQHRARLSRP